MCCVSGGASEEEEEIRGRAGGGEGRPVGDGHSSGHCAHLQYSKGSTALYPGEFDTCHTDLCIMIYFILYPTEVQ